MGFLLAYADLTLARSKGQGQGQGHAQFDCDYLQVGDRYGKRYNCHKTWCHIPGFSISIFSWPWPRSTWPLEPCPAKYFGLLLNVSFRTDKVVFYKIMFIQLNFEPLSNTSTPALSILKNDTIDSSCTSYCRLSYWCRSVFILSYVQSPHISSTSITLYIDCLLFASIPRSVPVRSRRQ